MDPSNYNDNILSKVSLATGIVCGTVLGYTLNPGGEFLNNALIATSCGVTRAACKIILDDPIIEQLMSDVNAAHNAQRIVEINGLLKRKKIYHLFYQGNLGFGIGIAIGNGVTAASLLTGFFSGVLVHAVGFYAEMLPVLAFAKPLKFEYDVQGHLIT
ncbi:MAG: hypothetical protein H0T62_03155 [Parachlamydiaceae bacterium]|nr:hypothetical protein [Parachlamydiaceae bacterium]